MSSQPAKERTRRSCCANSGHRARRPEKDKGRGLGRYRSVTGLEAELIVFDHGHDGPLGKLREQPSHRGRWKINRSKNEKFSFLNQLHDTNLDTM